ncbi:DUF3313 family protein [Luteolibacter sp. Populi]|uniref:DUF3313 family protein n=1 Tax=Luteolibacter sp. Populi TaxID=3230487 RepID=UPI00346605D3
MNIRSYLFVLCAAGLTGCQMFDAKPAADSGFNRSTAPVSTRAGFLQQAWVAPAYRGKPVKDHFSSVYIAPVDTRYMARQSWWQQQGEKKNDLAKDTDALAQRMRSQFKQAIAHYPGDNIPLASGPGPGVLVIELALVELVPSKAYWNAGATAAGFVVPGAGLLSAAGRGSIAIEGRARDGGSNTVIATFKDRRADKVAPVNLGSYSWYHGAEGNITDWAAEFAELLNTPPGHVVQRPSSVTLKPW